MVHCVTERNVNGGKTAYPPEPTNPAVRVSTPNCDFRHKFTGQLTEFIALSRVSLIRGERFGDKRRHFRAAF